jgi:hemerythrin
MGKGADKHSRSALASDPAMPPETTQRIIDAYSRFVPSEVLALIGKDRITGVELGDHVERTMTILFSDIRDFTTIIEEMNPQESFAFINSYLQHMEPVITRHNGIIDKFIGDRIMALFPTNADDALHCAIGMLDELVSFNEGRKEAGNAPLRIGIGLNTGLMMFGIIGGKHRMESTVISDAVNLASRIESMTRNYETPLLISEQTYFAIADVARHDTRFIDRVKLKGRKQPLSIFEVFDADPPALRDAKRKTKDMFEEALAQYHFQDVPAAGKLLAECLRQAPGDTAGLVYRARCERFMKTGFHEGSGEFDLVIQWDPSLEIGHAEIDAQHRELFDWVGNFAESIRKNRDYLHVHAIIEFLDGYAGKHFETEERYMAEKNYPFLQLQKDEHRRFASCFKSFEEEIRKDIPARRNFLLFRVQIFLIDWLVDHIAKLDGHFGKFLNRTAAAG